MMSVKELTKEQERTITYWSHCVKEVAKSKNIDLQLFIDELNKIKEQSDYENRS